ncbi:MAG TPA: aminomethyl transferase family protein [Chloroflexota bacterium]|nr:aminomethyl transferase family protein [Chloroflexota bacterium]
MDPDTPQPASSMAGVPVYPDVKLYANILDNMRIWEGDGWKPETMSWKTGCYLHSGLSGFTEFTFRGPEAARFLSMLSINGSDWPIGTSKHLVMLDEEGLIANHTLGVRDSEDSFRHFACPPWSIYKYQTAGMNVELGVREIFILQVAGPTSLQVLERATGESLRDVGFLDVRPTRVPDVDTAIEVTRIGMAGTLAYELRGDFSAGPAVYDRVYRAGHDLGIKRLGWRSYMVNHVEGGFPQVLGTFMYSGARDPQFVKMLPPTVANTEWTGSVDPSDLRARFRTPVELGWEWMARFDHDFIGREALEKEMAHPKRTIVTLRWNRDDVIDIYASLFHPGEEYRTLDLPSSPQPPAGGHADRVTKGGQQIGVSSGTTYSYYFREVISHCTIDRDQAEIGNEVIVHWGDYGKRIKEVRATVERFPYLDLPRNQTYDLRTVPSGVPAV